MDLVHVHPNRNNIADVDSLRCAHVKQDAMAGRGGGAEPDPATQVHHVFDLEREMWRRPITTDAHVFGPEHHDALTRGSGMSGSSNRAERQHERPATVAHAWNQIGVADKPGDEKRSRAAIDVGWCPRLH